MKPEFELYDETNAPEEVRPALANFKTKFGFIPNMQRAMAISPPMLDGYLHSFDDFAKTSFNPIEREVILITTSYLNNCTYCVAGHTGIAKMAKMPEDLLKALRGGTTLPDPKLEALKQFTYAMVMKRGMVSDEDTEAFLAAGWDKRHMIEVVLGVAHKVISNYVNQMVETPLDKAFEPNKWERPMA